MSTGGLSRARLDRMYAIMAGHVERGEVPGTVTLVSRRGKVPVHAIGMKAVEGALRTEVKRKFVGDLIVYLDYKIREADRIGTERKQLSFW